MPGKVPAAWGGGEIGVSWGGYHPNRKAWVYLEFANDGPRGGGPTLDGADGLAAPFAGEHTLAHVQKYVDEVVIVSDDEIIEAMLLIMERCKVVAEPAAAAIFAALLYGKTQVSPGETVVCVLSGGNIDRARLRELLQQA